MKKFEIEIKMVALLIPSFVLICVEAWWSPVLAVLWAVVAWKIAKRWRCKWVSRLARNRMLQRWLAEE